MIRFENPVKAAPWAECDSWFLQDMAEFAAAAPSEDIWKKFECLAPFDFGCSSSLDEMLSDIETELGGGSRGGFCSGGEIRHHDCMWAGLCHSKEHRLQERNSVPATTPAVPAPVVPEKKEVSVETPAPEAAKAAPPAQASPTTPASKRTGVIVQRTVGRSLLLNKAQKAAQSVKCETPPERPETPQSLSEDEEESSQRDEDWTPDKAVSASEVTNQVRRTAPPQPVVKSTNVQFDHNYDKSNGVRLEDLGLQTPSDSEEEEIDVVSVTALRGVSTLPTNPSRAVKAELQETVASITAGKLLSAASEAVSRRLRVGTRAKRKEEDDDEEEEYHQPKKRARKYYHRRHLYHYHHHHQGGSPRKTSRFSTDSETDTTEKRSQHNNMERMRRIDLRNAFEELRNLVPNLVDASRAAKVTILKDAAHYCYDLTSRSKALNSELQALRKEQDRLRSNLSKLRRNLAARR